MKHQTADLSPKRLSFKAMAELLGVPYRTAHFRFRNGYSLSDSLLAPVGSLMSHAQTKHGGVGTAEYAAWEGMHSRCRHHAHYIDRGITVCARWAAFELFLEDMGQHPGPGYTLDRIDGSLGYSLDNCRWATKREQSQNTSRNVTMTHRGETHCLAEWGRQTGLSQAAIANRINRGWSSEDVLTVPRWKRL